MEQDQAADYAESIRVISQMLVGKGNRIKRRSSTAIPVACVATVRTARTHALRNGETIRYSPNQAVCEIVGGALAVGMRHAQQNRQSHGDLAPQLA